MRWGIPDVEAWLQAIEPRVLDAWLAFQAIEPEAFEEPGAGSWEPGVSGRGTRGPMLDPAEAGRRMAKRLG